MTRQTGRSRVAQATSPPHTDPIQRRLPIGAEFVAGGVHFRVHATLRRKVSVVFSRSSIPEFELVRDQAGYHSGFQSDVPPGTRYRYRLDGGDTFPDPVSRYQPDGPHGASVLVDPSSFQWTDGGWSGPRREHQLFYEMHVGTFTRDGTWEAASEHLPYLSELGVTVIEMMPVAEFPGQFGWGYDGVQFFAPYHHYGEPDDMRRFVDRAHSLGMAVVLDVVYNHFGPDGNYLAQYTDAMESTRQSDWGASINYDGPGSESVREFVLANVQYWIEEFHLDGLRLDATQDIHDDSPEHIVLEIVRRARDAAGSRTLLIAVENEPQEARLVRARDAGGFGADYLWNDDFHHSAIVALTGRREAYLTDYDGTARELGASVRWGYLYQGQWFDWQGKPRGTSALDLEPLQFINYLENHDQLSNLARGKRVHQLTSPARWRALTALLLLGPGTPLLFQGQEFASSSPFLFFADHTPSLAKAVRDGRREFLSQFPRVNAEFRDHIADPDSEETFTRCVLDHAEREANDAALALHRDLLELRRSDHTIASAMRPEFAAFGEDILVLRWIAGEMGDRLLVLNLGRTRRLTAASDPLLAPPANAAWRTTWSSEQPTYGGEGTPPLTDVPGGPWTVAAECAYFLVPEIDATSFP